MNTEVIIIIVVAVLVLLAVVAFFVLKKEKYTSNPTNTRQKKILLEMIDQIKNSSYWFYDDLEDIDKTLSEYISTSPTTLAYKGVKRSLLTIYFYMKDNKLNTSDIANTEELIFLKEQFPKFTNSLP